MLQICTQQYATAQYKAVRCRFINNSMIHVRTQQYATGPTKKYATDLYTTVCYFSA